MKALIGSDGILQKSSAGNSGINSETENIDRITFGTVHLNITDLKATTYFWTKIAGMKLRIKANNYAEFGSESHTLVVVHQTATSVFREGYSGLYHYAIHAPDKVEFARMIQRLIDSNYSFSPIDHTMSKSIYLRDPDNILVEVTLETPERFKRVISKNGLYMEDTDGTIRGVSDALNINEELKALRDRKTEVPLHPDTRIGHIHFYASDLESTNEFYKKLGFAQFNKLPRYKYADLGAGGVYRHRVAMNTWHGFNMPVAPEGNAGLRHYTLVFESGLKLNEALDKVARDEKKDFGNCLSDPSGNKLCLCAK